MYYVYGSHIEKKIMHPFSTNIVLNHFGAEAGAGSIVCTPHSLLGHLVLVQPPPTIHTSKQYLEEISLS